MIFFLTSYTTQHTSKLSNIVWALGNTIQTKVAARDYFPFNVDIFIGIACEEPPFQGKYKYLRPRLNPVKSGDGKVTGYKFQYIIIIPYEKVGHNDLVVLIKKYLSESFVFFDEIKAFDASLLKRDLIDAVMTYKHAPTHL